LFSSVINRLNFCSQQTRAGALVCPVPILFPNWSLGFCGAKNPFDTPIDHLKNNSILSQPCFQNRNQSRIKKNVNVIIVPHFKFCSTTSHYIIVFIISLYYVRRTLKVRRTYKQHETPIYCGIPNFFKSSKLSSVNPSFIAILCSLSVLKPHAAR